MIFRIAIASLIIILSICGMVYWNHNADEIINTHFATDYGTQCHVFESGCIGAQVLIYFFPYFLCIGFIGISIAIIYSSCRSVVL